MSTTYFGKEGFRWFVGVVADILDPEQLGRVRVRIFGTHDDTTLIQDEDLPWAQVLVSPTSASLAGVGITPVGLAPDSYVVGFFADGMEEQFPIILGSFHKMPQKDPNLSDVNILARGTNKLVKTPIGPEPESPYKAQYPKNQVFESKSGHIIEIDDTDGDERIHIYHKKGTYIEIDKTGKLVIKSQDSSIDVSAADKHIYAKSDINIASDANINITAKDELRLKAKDVLISGGTSSVRLADEIASLTSNDIKISGDYLKVATPDSMISGTKFSGGAVTASSITSSKVSASSIASKTTANLASSVGKLSGSLKSLSSLSGIGNIGDLTSALDGAFGSMSSSISGLANNLMDDALENVMSEVEKIQGTVSNLAKESIDFDNKFRDIAEGRNK